MGEGYLYGLVHGRLCLICNNGTHRRSTLWKEALLEKVCLLWLGLFNEGALYQ